MKKIPSAEGMVKLIYLTLVPLGSRTINTGAERCILEPTVVESGHGQKIARAHRPGAFLGSIAESCLHCDDHLYPRP